MKKVTYLCDRCGKTERLRRNTEKMKTKDLMEFLRQFNPDSEISFLVTMLS